MKKKYTKLVYCTILMLFSAFVSVAQSNSFWTEIDKSKASSSELHFRKTEPIKATFYNLNLEALKRVLVNAPQREDLNVNSNLNITLPAPNGKLEVFKVVEASVMASELQARYPELRSYTAQSVNNPGTVLRFSITNKGLHVMGSSPKDGTFYVDPYSKLGNNYIVYNKKDLPALEGGLDCQYVNTEADNERFTNSSTSLTSLNANDGMMRNYRLAVATTIEYSEFHWTAAGLNAGSPIADKRAAVMAAIIVTITRNNFIYERELSITMTLVGNNDSIVFIDNDNFNNDNAQILINQSQTEIDNVIGSANYDIGHTFSTGGGGLAQLGSPCGNDKARGITGGPNPVGDPYDIDFVAHELGHQFGAPHTWNGTQGNCTTGSRGDNDAYEVGSGTTIMAYAGICAGDNVQGNSDAYFHQKSLDRIFTFVSSAFGGGCSNNTNTGNNAPTADAGAALTLPISTPYKLTGSSTDQDGTATHTFTWEQYDLGPAGLPLEANNVGPMVRSFEGTSNPVRFIPNLSDLKESNGNSTTWEKLPSVSRSQSFRLTVRDNDVRGGQTAVSPVTVNFLNNAGPFRVTSQNIDQLVWTPGDTETISWDVNNTDNGAAGSPNVNILLSTDNGLTYTTTLIANVPNDGSQDIVVPNVQAANCRIMVEAATNAFFNINTKNIAIGNYVYQVNQGCNDYTINPNALVDENSNSFSSFPINVPDSFTITDLNVSVDASHNTSGSIFIAVVPPSVGAQVRMVSGSCIGPQDLVVTYDDAGGAINCASTNTNDNVTPAQALNVANGGDSQGQWLFFITDINIGDGDRLTLNSATLNICFSEIVPILATESFNFEDNLGIYPNPNNGEFTVNLKQTKSNKVTVNVHDLRGRKIYDNAFKTQGSLNENINLGSVQSGVYLVSVNDGENQITKKILVN